jgi:YD repeat-containing protein
MPLKKVEDIKFIPVVERYEYDGAGDVIYAGYADRNTATSSQGWKISRYTYDGSKNMVLKQIAYGSWDERASLVYG